MQKHRRTKAAKRSKRRAAEAPAWICSEAPLRPARRFLVAIHRMICGPPHFEPTFLATQTASGRKRVPVGRRACTLEFEHIDQPARVAGSPAGHQVVRAMKWCGFRRVPQMRSTNGVTGSAKTRLLSSKARSGNTAAAGGFSRNTVLARDALLCSRTGEGC